MLTSNCGFDAANDQFAVKSDEELRRSLLTFLQTGVTGSHANCTVPLFNHRCNAAHCES